MNKQCTIAIIGAGASGIALLNQVVRAIPSNLSRGNLNIVVFEGKNGRIGGNAYEQDSASNLMNTTCRAIDRNFGSGFGILQWLESNPEKWNDLSPKSTVSEKLYLPRAVVGRYLEDLYENAKKIANESGINVEIEPSDVNNIHPGPERYSLVTADGKTWETRYVYLALGHLESKVSHNYELAPSYHHSPYPVSTLTSEIPKEAAVGVIGTRLSAIDACIALAENGHKGPIYCVSRSGRLPAVRAEKGSHQFSELSRERILNQKTFSLNLSEIVSLLHHEIIIAEGRELELDKVLGKHMSPEAYYQHEITISKGKARPWQSVLYATNTNIDLLWNQLPESDRTFVFHNWLSEWFLYRASIPVSNAEKMLQLLMEKRISIYAGARNIDYDYENEKFLVELEESDGIKVDHLINAKGSENNITKTTNVLVNNLLKARLITPNPYGGVDCCFETGEVVSNRSQAKGIFALGPITNGVYFFTTALEIIERQAKERAQDLVFRLASDQFAQKRTWVESNLLSIASVQTTHLCQGAPESIH